MRFNRLLPAALSMLLLALSILPISAATPRTAAEPDVRPGPGVTKTAMLSDYFSGLAGAAGDTPVYFLDGSMPGPTVLILGGTHGNEIAGVMTASLIIERARVSAGRLIVVPRANNSASTNSLRGWPGQIELRTPSGTRSFRYGSRLTNPLDETRDPSTFVHYPTGMEYPGEESRNLDRCHPGKADGNLTQRVAYGFLQLILREKPEVAIDLHEAPPGDRLAYMLIANPKCLQLGVMASLSMAERGLSLQIEQSSALRGLSHREWGDRTPVNSFIIETGHPGMILPASADKIVNDDKNPLWYRVGFHLAVIGDILTAYDEVEGSAISIMGLPSMDDLRKSGLGAYFN